METSRFAPSPTGPAHPGTLLAALLCWLDARSEGVRLLLRFEDLDPERCKPAYLESLRNALDWLGLEFDAVSRQTANAGAHEAALDTLAARGDLYPCACSRAEIRAQGRPGADGGFVYPGTCRERQLPAGSWREVEAPLRFRLPDRSFEIEDASGLDLSQHPGRVLGDPVVRRRDGAASYHLAGVVDDAAGGVTRVVRGRDLAVTTATQVALQEALGISTPRYRHHLLLLEERGQKLAKLHGSASAETLRGVYSAEQFCGILARCAGLRDDSGPTTPGELLDGFDWSRVATRDRVLRWNGASLELGPSEDPDSFGPAAGSA